MENTNIMNNVNIIMKDENFSKKCKMYVIIEDFVGKEMSKPIISMISLSLMKKINPIF